jgi:hypothetical protein
MTPAARYGLIVGVYCAVILTLIFVIRLGEVLGWWR